MEQKTGVSIVKWLVIGFLGSLALIFTFVVVLVLMFSPVIRIDEPKGKVVVLGGLIEVTGKTKGQNKEMEQVKIEASTHFEVDLSEKGLSSFALDFNVGELTIKTSPDSFLRVNCEKPQTFNGRGDKNKFVLGLTEGEALKCDVLIPEKVSSVVKGGNGKLSIMAPRFDLQVKMVNAKMNFVSAEGVDYKFNNSVAYGTMDTFNSSEKKDAYKISLSLVNGTLNKGN